jgi:phage-related minor tail protein
VNASQDMLIDLFERIESIFKRIECYTELKPSEEMRDMMVKIMVEVLTVLAIVTVEIKERRRSQFIITNDF